MPDVGLARDDSVLAVWARGAVALVGFVVVAATLGACAVREPEATCPLEPAEVSEALGTSVTKVAIAPAGTGPDSGYMCSYGDESSARVVDVEWWPGSVAIGNEAEDPDGTRNPEPATVVGSPTAYFTNSGKAIRFSDGTNAYTIWIYDGTRPEPSALEGLAELVLARVAVPDHTD